MFGQLFKKTSAIFIALAALTMQAHGLIYVHELDTEFSGGTEPAGPSPWLTATFQDIDANTVSLTLSNLNLVEKEFVGSWYFNFNEKLDIDKLKFKNIGGTAVKKPSISTGSNKFKAAGDGYYDIEFDFPTKKKDRFVAQDTLVYEISSPNPISGLDFSFTSEFKGEVGSWYSAAHVQSIDSKFSGWIGGGPEVAVPEPSTYLMLGSLLGTILLFSRRRIV